jgi:hypothetical protein
MERLLWDLGPTRRGHPFDLLTQSPRRASLRLRCLLTWRVMGPRSDSGEGQ